jgi:hypothetical protein
LPGVDVRGDGGFVVAPPSQINLVEYLANGVTTFAPLPAWFAKIRKPTRAEALPEEPIAEGGRNAALTSLAGTMRRRGMGVAEIEAALLVTNATRCKPPLPDRDIHTIATSVGRYDPEEPIVPAAVPTVIVVAESGFPWVAPEEESGGEEEDAIVTDLVYPGSKTLCISLPKVGKSTFAVGMCAAIRAVEREPFLDRAVEPCNILYLTEEPRATFAATLERAGIEGHDQGFQYLRRGMAGVAGVPWPKIVEGTVKRATDIGAELVVVDVLHRWAGFVDGGENASDKVNQAISELTPLSEAGIAVWILAHSPWGEKRVRGSTDIFGAVDDGWFIEGEAGSSGARSIRWIGGRHEPKQALTAYTLSAEGRLEYQGKQTYEQASKTGAVVDVVRLLAVPSSTMAVATELGWNERTARRWLERAQQHGSIGHDLGPHAEYLWRPRRVREWMEGRGT